jgi:hypothetical protein
MTDANEVAIPRALDRLLSRQTSTLYQAFAVLEMVSNALTVGDLDDRKEVGRLMSAVGAALALLRPIPDRIGCEVSVRRAIQQMETEDQQ